MRELLGYLWLYRRRSCVIRPRQVPRHPSSGRWTQVGTRVMWMRTDILAPGTNAPLRIGHTGRGTWSARPESARRAEDGRPRGGTAARTLWSVVVRGGSTCVPAGDLGRRDRDPQGKATQIFRRSARNSGSGRAVRRLSQTEPPGPGAIRPCRAEYHRSIARHLHDRAKRAKDRDRAVPCRDQVQKRQEVSRR